MTTWIMSCSELDPVNCTSSTVQWMDYYAFDPLGITPLSIAYVFSWGMAAILTFWSIGYCAGLAVAAIRKV